MSEMRSRTAIIVDDHPLARMAIRGVLEKDRVTVLGEYEDGAIALKSLLKTTADIVVIDVEIPGVNGVELVEKLRANHYRGVLG